MASLGDLGAALAGRMGALDQRMAEMNAHLRNGVAGASQAINDFYQEARRYVKSFDEQRGFRYRPATIQLSANISGVGANAGSSDFRISMNEDFIVHEVRGFILLNQMQLEPAAFANLSGSNSAADRAFAKAVNCSVQLINKDTKVPVMENANISLATICPEVGGKVMKFNPDIVPGFLLPHNVTLQALFNLQSNDAFFNTASTTYGVSLSGVYMSRDRY